MYMAPEMFMAEVEIYDKVVDSWSLGIMVSVMQVSFLFALASTS